MLPINISVILFDGTHVIERENFLLGLACISILLWCWSGPKTLSTNTLHLLILVVGVAADQPVMHQPSRESSRDVNCPHTNNFENMYLFQHISVCYVLL